MSKIDLNTLVRVDEEVKKLESRRGLLEGDVERLTKDIAKMKDVARGEINAEKKAVKDASTIRETELNRREKEVAKKEKDIKAWKDELGLIEEKWKKVKQAEENVKAEMKLAEEAKVNYLQRERELKLKIEQFDAKIAMLNSDEVVGIDEGEEGEEIEEQPKRKVIKKKVTKRGK